MFSGGQCEIGENWIFKNCARNERGKGEDFCQRVDKRGPLVTRRQLLGNCTFELFKGCERRRGRKEWGIRLGEGGKGSGVLWEEK